MNKLTTAMLLAASASAATCTAQQRQGQTCAITGSASWATANCSWDGSAATCTTNPTDGSATFGTCDTGAVSNATGTVLCAACTATGGTADCQAGKTCQTAGQYAGVCQTTSPTCSTQGTVANPNQECPIGYVCTKQDSGASVMCTPTCGGLPQVAGDCTGSTYCYDSGIIAGYNVCAPYCVTSPVNTPYKTSVNCIKANQYCAGTSGQMQCMDNSTCTPWAIATTPCTTGQYCWGNVATGTPTVKACVATATNQAGCDVTFGATQTVYQADGTSATTKKFCAATCAAADVTAANAVCAGYGFTSATNCADATALTLNAGLTVGTCYTPTCPATACTAGIQTCNTVYGLCAQQACTGTPKTCPSNTTSMMYVCPPSGTDQDKCSYCAGTSGYECLNYMACTGTSGSQTCNTVACNSSGYPSSYKAGEACHDQQSTVCSPTIAGTPGPGTCALCSTGLPCPTGWTCDEAATNPKCIADVCGAAATTPTCPTYQDCATATVVGGNTKNQCYAKACTGTGAAEACPVTGYVCISTKCAPCQSVTSGDGFCGAGAYCDMATVAMCKADCGTNTLAGGATCMTWATCDTTLGKCNGKVCTADDTCADTTTSPVPAGTPTAVCTGATGSKTCQACTGINGTSGTSPCTTVGDLCSTGSADQLAATPVLNKGACYNPQCTGTCKTTGASPCASCAQQCTAEALCTDVTCSTFSTCDTKVCTGGKCAKCSITGTTSTCQTTGGTANVGYWCNATDGMCYEGTCSADTACTITQACDTTTTTTTRLTCVAQTCSGASGNSQCRSGLCAATTASSACITCSGTAACQATATGGTTSMYCNAATTVAPIYAQQITDGTVAAGQCFTTKCANDAACSTVTDSCARGVCATTGSQTAACNASSNPTTCRSNADGTGTAGVCSTTGSTAGQCVQCAAGAADTNGKLTKGTCPGDGDYCNTTTAGNFFCTASTCSPATCTDTATCAPHCDADANCNVNGSGTCDTIVCTAPAGCATQVCPITSPATSGVCGKCDSTAGSGNECPDTGDDDTWYTCNTETGVCQKEEDSGISGGGIAGIIIGSVVFLGAVVGLTLYCCKKDSKSHDAMQEALK